MTNSTTNLIHLIMQSIILENYSHLYRGNLWFNSIELQFNLLLNLRDQTHMGSQLMLRVSLSLELQLIHLHSHSSEVRSSGWIMASTLMTGELIKWRLQMREFHMHPLFNWRLQVKQHQTRMGSQPIRRASQFQELQLTHLHSHLSEVRSSGWIMARTLMTGVISR
jgi:hypothetical protein